MPRPARRLSNPYSSRSAVAERSHLMTAVRRRHELVTEDVQLGGRTGRRHCDSVKWMPTPELDSLVAGTHRDPHTLLGPHLNGDGTVIRVLRPDAASVTVQANDDSYPAELVHRGGVFEARLPGKVTDYRLEIEYATGTFTADDPYRFPPTVGEI